MVKREGHSNSSAPAGVQADLFLAREMLQASETVSAVLVKGGKVLGMVSGAGVQPLIDLLYRAGEGSRGATLGDKVVGLAPAWLVIQARVRAVFARTISAGALDLLQRHNVKVEFLKQVPVILAADGKTPCPLEEALLPAQTLEEALRILRHHPFVALP